MNKSKERGQGLDEGKIKGRESEGKRKGKEGIGRLGEGEQKKEEEKDE